MSWIVVILKQNQSKRAEENLANQGFETFFQESLTHIMENQLLKISLPVMDL